MRVSELTRQKPVDLTMDLGDGDTITLTFDRNKVTSEWVERGRMRLSLSPALAEVILAWDLVNDDGTPYAASPENLSVLSFAVQTELLSQIIENAIPSRAEGNASPVPTSTPPLVSTEPELISQNGVVTSPSPAPSASLSQT